MLIDEFHPEDIKAAIRKRYRSVVRFERAEKLTKGSVAEILRGRRSSQTERAIRRVLAEEARFGSIRSILVEHSANEGAAHPHKAEAA